MKRRDSLQIIGLAFLSPLPLLSVSAAKTKVKMRDFYTKKEINDFARSLENTQVEMRGYMAPPLLAESNFFVLTKIPMSTCPFCETEAEWPDDIIAVYTKDIVKIIPYSRAIYVSGLLELGTKTDEQTGFVSRIRLMDAHYKLA